LRPVACAHAVTTWRMEAARTPPCRDDDTGTAAAADDEDDVDNAAAAEAVDRRLRHAPGAVPSASQEAPPVAVDGKVDTGVPIYEGGREASGTQLAVEAPSGRGSVTALPSSASPTRSRSHRSCRIAASSRSAATAAAVDGGTVTRDAAATRCRLTASAPSACGCGWGASLRLQCI